MLHTTFKATRVAKVAISDVPSICAPLGVRSLSSGGDKAVVTAALNGVFTDPTKFNIPVTPQQMATAAHEAYNEGASVVHIHFRDQREGMGHLPSWDPEVAKAIVDAIREKTPGLLINLTTGTVGKKGPMGGGELGPTEGPLSCIAATDPEIAALNSGSLNYLRLTSKGEWAWPPIVFDNPVSKVQTMLEGMRDLNVIPECECFDTGIVRSIAMFHEAGIIRNPMHVSFVMGVASGMPAKPEWLPLLIDELPDRAHWQTIAIGREEVWPLLRRASELGGNVRTGLEDTFYKPDGSRAETSGELIRELVKVVRETGREPATVEEAADIISSV